MEQDTTTLEINMSLSEFVGSHHGSMIDEGVTIKIRRELLTSDLDAGGTGFNRNQQGTGR
jgi:hypothetical protein